MTDHISQPHVPRLGIDMASGFAAPTDEAPRSGRDLRAVPVTAGAIAAAVGVLRLLVGWSGGIGELSWIVNWLVAIGLAAELVPFPGLQGRKSTSSIGNIPYLAALLLAPTAVTALAIGAASAIVQLYHRRAPVRAAFNIAQILLAMALAALPFSLASTGTPRVGTEDFAGTLWSWIIPTVSAFAAYATTNRLLIALVLFLVSGQRLRTDDLRKLLSGAPLTLLQSVFVVYLAWLSAALGPVGTLGMLLPLFAVHQLLRATVQLTRVTEDLLDLMVAAIEARDPYTSGHSKRVAATAVTIAESLGLDRKTVERVQIAALLHDVGKIYEEFAVVLTKEGRLTPEEWEIMKRHPVRSAHLVGLVSTLRDVVPGVRHHHENWDGTGYPDGIAAAEIPLASRIIMFADTLDAITTDRPYRRALEPEEARKEFMKFRGRQFDPTICDVVVSDRVWARLYAVARDRAAETPSEVRVAVA